MGVAEVQVEQCWTNCFGARWTTGPWSDCKLNSNSNCGNGFQSRKLSCYVEDGDKDKLVPNSNCNELRRPLQEMLFKFIINLLY